MLKSIISVNYICKTEIFFKIIGYNIFNNCGYACIIGKIKIYIISIKQFAYIKSTSSSYFYNIIWFNISFI